MKPQLVIQDLAGINNGELKGATTKRLEGGRAWKRERIIAIVPTVNAIPAKCALAMWNLIFPPNQPAIRMLALGMEVGDAYSEAVDQILAHPELSKWEYILTMEYDNAPPPDGILRLIKRLEENKNLDCVGGLYFTKGDEGVAQIWGDPKDPITNFRPQVPVADSLQECCGTGMGFNLFRMSMFRDKKLPRPFFKTLSGMEGVGTQDLMFWAGARKLGYRCAVDTACKVGHYHQETDTMF